MATATASTALVLARLLVPTERGPRRGGADDRQKCPRSAEPDVAGRAPISKVTIFHRAPFASPDPIPTSSTATATGSRAVEVVTRGAGSALRTRHYG